MKRLLFILTICFSLSALSSSGWAQSSKWQRDLDMSLLGIEDRQKDILAQLDRMEQKFEQIAADIEDVKKKQRSFVNPKWGP